MSDGVPRTKDFAPAAHRRSEPRWARSMAAWATRLFCIAPLTVVIAGATAFVGAAVIGWFRHELLPTSLFRASPLSEGLAIVEAILPLTLLVWACVGCLGSWIAATSSHRAARLWRRGELVLGRRLRRYGLPLAITVFGFVVAAIWSQAPRIVHAYDHSEYSALLGHIPWSDAHGYFWGAQKIAAERELDVWSQRRPLNAALYSVRLAAAAFRPDAALLLQVLLLAVSVYLVADAAGMRYGVWAGIGAFALLTAYAKLFVATTLSETLGVTLGSLGAALLLHAIHRRHVGLAAAGAFATALALSARAGALFILPALLVWAFCHFGAGWRRRTTALAVVAAGIVLAVTVNYAVLRVYGTGQNSLGSNFAPTLCGMAEGSSWGPVYKKYAVELSQCDDERQQAAFLYAKAWESFRADPAIMFEMMWRGESQFLRAVPDFVRSLSAISLPPTQSWVRKLARVNRCVYYVIGCGLLVTLWRRRRDGDYRLWTLFALAVLASVPFIFLDGGWRVLAASWPLLAVLLGGGLATAFRQAALPLPVSAEPQSFFLSPLAKCRADWRRWDHPLRLNLGVTCAVAGLAVIGPWFVWLVAPKPQPEAIASARDAGQTLVRSWPHAAAVAVVGDGQSPLAEMPSVTLSEFKALVARARHEEIAQLLPLPPTPFTLTETYDFVAQRSLLLVGPLEAFANDEPFTQLAVDPKPRGGLFWLVLDTAKRDNHAQTDLRQLRR